MASLYGEISESTENVKPTSKWNTIASMGTKRMELAALEQQIEITTSLDLTSEDVEEIRVSFDLFDIHGSGAITGAELQKIAGSVGRELSEEDVVEIIGEIDETGNKGEIDFLDFLNVMGKASKEPLQDSDIDHVFNTFDQNGDSFISPDDMHRTFLTLGVDLTAAELNAIFEEYDDDRDGLISLDEFKPWVEQAHEDTCKIADNEKSENVPSQGII